MRVVHIVCDRCGAQEEPRRARSEQLRLRAAYALAGRRGQGRYNLELCGACRVGFADWLGPLAERLEGLAALPAGASAEAPAPAPEPEAEPAPSFTLVGARS